MFILIVTDCQLWKLAITKIEGVFTSNFVLKKQEINAMKTCLARGQLVPVLLLCVVGLCAAFIGWRSLDAWCQRQLTDTDGQPETN